jgi:hypothetical protein
MSSKTARAAGLIPATASSSSPDQRAVLHPSLLAKGGLLRSSFMPVRKPYLIGCGVFQNIAGSEKVNF